MGSVMRVHFSPSLFTVEDCHPKWGWPFFSQGVRDPMVFVGVDEKVRLMKRSDLRGMTVDSKTTKKMRYRSAK